jgi:transcriptional regulator with XRE-family HTH domain
MAHMSDKGPEHIGPRPLTGYRLRDYNHAIAVLRNSREGQRLGQRVIGARVGTTQSAICDWETGRTEPLASSLIRLADALGYDLALVPRDADAPSARIRQPQSAENGSGVPRPTPSDPKPAKTSTGGSA